MERVITYIDGFNLYFGMMAKNLGNGRWLNVQALAYTLLRPTQTLVGTKYFTAEISGPIDKRKRQQTYVDALRTREGPEFAIYYGRYQSEQVTCRVCGHMHMTAHEKMTDVNIAVEMLKDAFEDAFDTALLISGDADLVAPVATLKRTFANKRVVIAFPPKRHSADLMRAAHGHLFIGPASIHQSQFPNPVVRSDGFLLEQPSTWR